MMSRGRHLTIIAGLLAVLTSGFVMPCVDCDSTMVMPMQPSVGAAACCATECPMEHHESCGLANGESQKDSSVAVLVNEDHAPKTDASTVVFEVASTVDSPMTLVSPAFDGRSIHDPPGPSLTLLHSQFLI